MTPVAGRQAWISAAALALAATTAHGQQFGGVARVGDSLGAQLPSQADVIASERLVTRFDSLRLSRRIPGLAAVVLRDTTVVLARGFGMADVERGVSVTPNTPFNIASVAKPMAGVVALKLVQQGLLDLDRSMTSYDGFREFCAAVRGVGGIFWGDYACDTDALTLRHVLTMTANGTPGTRFLYNPPSFSWGSRPLMQVSGVPYSTLVDSLVFRPAKMARSARKHRALPLREDLAGDLAKPYHTDSSGVLRPSPPPGPQGDGAAGGVIATAMDLARFDIALTRGTLLPDSLRTVMWSPTRTATGAVLPYGLGWFVQEHEGETLLWHSGLWEGAYSAIYLRVPSRRITLILLANSDGLWWDNPLDGAQIHRSPFVAAFLEAFPLP
jgi:CubicO group peptidase (beta-lactamase class C family)